MLIYRSKLSPFKPDRNGKPGACAGLSGMGKRGFGMNSRTDASDKTQKPAFRTIFLILTMLMRFMHPGKLISLGKRKNISLR
jgi:hypothetical protein